MSTITPVNTFAVDGGGHFTSSVTAVGGVSFSTASTHEPNNAQCVFFSTHIALTNNSHLEVHRAGSGPSVSACATGPTIEGTDLAGRITVGTITNPTACTVTFGRTYNGAVCWCNTSNVNFACRVGNVPATASITLQRSDASAMTNGETMEYFCVEIR